MKPALKEPKDIVELSQELASLPRLPPKREKFVEIYLSTNSIYKAITAAGYSKKSAYKQAYKLLHDPVVSRTIELRKIEFRMRNEVTQDYFIQRLKDIVEDSYSSKTERIAALNLLARITGFIKERTPEQKQLVILRQESSTPTKSKPSIKEKDVPLLKISEQN